MDEDPSIASDMEWLRRLQHHPHLRSVCEACEGLEYRLGKLLEDGTPCALHAACAQILRERSLLSSFGTGPLAGILRDAENIMEKMTDGTYGTPSAMIGIDGNWVLETAFVGEVVVVPRGFDVENVRSLRAGLADCAIYVCNDRPTVGELNRWGDEECLIVSSGGGSNTEEWNFASSSSMPYVNCVRRGFDQLLQHEGQVVMVRPGQGEVIMVRPSSPVSPGDRTLGRCSHPSAMIGIDGNWVLEGAFLGEVVLVPKDFDVENVRSLRAGLADCAIYVCAHRPTVGELSRWGDEKCLIVSSEGSSTSEDWDVASAGSMAYVNGVRWGFDQLVHHAGQVVTVRPSSPTSPPDPPGFVAPPPGWLRSRATELDHASILDFLWSAVTHPNNRRLAAHYLLWSTESEPECSGLCDELRKWEDRTRLEGDIEEARRFPHKQYPEGKVPLGASSIIRALGRFGAAKERGDSEYALYLARALPNEALAQLLERIALALGAPRETDDDGRGA